MNNTEVDVCGLVGDQICVVAVTSDWSIRAIKESIKAETDIPPVEQHLLLGNRDLCDTELVGDILPPGMVERLSLMLVRRAMSERVVKLVSDLTSPPQSHARVCQALKQFRQLENPGEEGVAGAVEVIEGLLHVEQFRHDAAHTLNVLGEFCVPTLIRMLNNESDDVQRSAWSGLLRVGVPGLVAVLRDSTVAESDHTQAINHLRALDASKAEAACSTLVNLLSAESAPVRRAASGLLVRVGDAGVSSLHSALADKRALVRYKACETLGEMGSAAETIVPAIEQLLSDDDAGVRQQAVRSLGRIGTPNAVLSLGSSLANENCDLRPEAMNALLKLGPLAGPVAGMIGNVLADENWQVAVQASRSLANLGEAAAPAVPALEHALASRVQGAGAVEIRATVAKTLGRLGAGAHALEVALTDPDCKVRREAAVGLLKQNVAETRALEELLTQLDNDDARVREQTAIVLGQLGSKVALAIPKLQTIVREDADFDVRGRAWESLERLGATDFQ